jgi:putative ABC transport system permease protein
MNFNQTLRSLLRDKLNSLVIIISLSAGIACINLIFLFLWREISTDGFQRDKSRIYLLKCDDPWIPGAKMYFCRYGATEYMKNNFPQVEDFCRFNNQNALKINVNNEDFGSGPGIIGASKNFFSFFSYKLITNNPETVLEAANNIVISSELAEKYFGSEDPIGKVIRLTTRTNTEQMTISGIFEKPVSNTQINFDMVRLIGEADGRCYIKLVKDTDPAEMEKLFAEKKDVIPIIHTGTPGKYYLEPLQSAYFDKSRGWTVELSRDKKDLWIALLIGLMVISIAIFNYLGIITNKFYRKVKEYYIRRINGSTVNKLIAMLSAENSILVIISFIISLFMMTDAIPFFNKITGSTISGNFITQTSQIILLAVILGFILLMTFLFDYYLIKRNMDLNLLKTDKVIKLKSIQIPVFNILQIAGSIGLIICSLIIVRQIKYISSKPIGLDKDVIEIKIPQQYKDKAPVFKNELLKNGSIENVSVTSASPLLEHFLLALKYNDNGIEKEYYPAGFSGDENYLDVLGIDLIEGKGFSEILSPNTKKCLINQSFAKLFKGQDLVGKGMPGMNDVIITGIIRDFNYSDLKSKIEPAFVSFDEKGGHLLVKASANMIPEARRTITGIWEKLIPDYPVDIESVGERFEWYHRSNENFLKLIGSCSLLCLLLSLIGLFAVSYQKTSFRTKEIGIRKINGANVTEILLLITGNFAGWILIAFLIAVPSSWYAMDKWLEGYVYRADIKWWIFAVSGLMVLAVSFLTIIVQSLKAARKNPVESLKYE